MVLVRFKDDESERQALGRLAGRFSFRSFASGETLVPEEAVAFLAVEGISFQVEGRATYEQRVPAIRGPAASTLQ